MAPFARRRSCYQVAYDGLSSKKLFMVIVWVLCGHLRFRVGACDQIPGPFDQVSSSSLMFNLDGIPTNEYATLQHTNNKAFRVETRRSSTSTERNLRLNTPSKSWTHNPFQDSFISDEQVVPCLIVAIFVAVGLVYSLLFPSDDQYIIRLFPIFTGPKGVTTTGGWRRLDLPTPTYVYRSDRIHTMETIPETEDLEI